MSAPHVSAKAIFLQALELITVAERDEYLDQHCGSDADLRCEVEELLRHHGDVGSFLHSPPTEVVDSAEELHKMAPPPSLGFLSPPSRADSLGRLGHYEVLEVVGSGGMGVVLRAFDERLQRIVAIKVMASALAASAIGRQRFVREAQAAAAVNHDNVVDIYAVEESDPVPYIVMEYIAGISLEDKLQQQGSLSLKEILRIGLQTADGLAAAHRQGLVHRDVKPANILLENGVERVKITDFGLARAADDVSITQTGVIAGTPAYMSPEQARGEAVDHRSDLFSLGSVLYSLCTGRAPFRSSTSLGMLRQVCDEQPHPIRDLNPDIPEWLCLLVEKLHAKLPAERFQSAVELAEALGEYLAHIQQSTKPMPSRFVSEELKPRTPVRGLFGSGRRWVAGTVAALVLLLFGLSLTDASGITHVAATVIRILTPDGTLVVESDDPAVRVTVEGDGGLVITGAGSQEVRLRPGSYKVKADKDGKPVPLERDLVSIAVGGREVVKIKLESQNGTSSAQLFDAHEVRLFKGHTGSVKDVAFSPDGTQALSSSGYPQGDRSVRLWDIATGKQIQSFETSGTQILTVCFSSDGQWVAGGGFGGVVRIWDTATGRLIASLDSKAEIVEDLAFSPDGRHLLCATHKRAFATRPGLSGWGKAILWDTQTEKLIWEFTSDGWLTACGFLPSGERVVVAGRQTGSAMVLLDGKTGKQLQRFEFGNVADFQIEDLAVSRDGRFVATASETGYVLLWDSAGAKPIEYRSNMGNLRSVAFSPDDSKLLCGSGEGATGRIELLDVPSLGAIGSVEHPSGLVWSVAYAPDGRHVLSTGGFAKEPADGDYALRLWSLPKGAWPKDLEASGGATVERQPQFDYVQQANEHAAGGRLDQAAEAFDTALNLIADPNAYGPERLRVVDQFVASDELFLRIVKLRPDDRTLWGLRGHHLAKAARWEDSIACYQKHLDLGPDGAGLWEIYSLALLAGNDEAGYRIVCEKMLAGFANNGDPLEAGHAAMAMAIVPDSVQDKQLAFGLAERAVQGNPDQFWWTNLAYAAWLYRLDRLEEALVALDERKNKDYPECSFCFLAMAHHRLGHTEEARRYADAVRQRKSAWSDTLPWYDRVRVEKLIVEMDSVLAAEPDQSPALQAEDTKTPATR